jgi:hypothetical protein
MASKEIEFSEIDCGVVDSECDVENADESVGNMETMPEAVNKSADLYASSHLLTSENDSDEESDEATVVRFDFYTIKTAD